MPNEEPKNNLNTQTGGVSELDEETEQEETHKGNWREAFRTAFERARRQHKPAAGRQELGRDKSKAFFCWWGQVSLCSCSSSASFPLPKKRTPLPGETPHGQASLGRKVTPGQENTDPSTAATPMLSADIRSTDSGPSRAGDARRRRANLANRRSSCQT